MNYPPPVMDAKPLAAHICLSERTIEMRLKTGKLPPPIQRCGKNLWKWSDVVVALESGTLPDVEANRIREATRATVRGV